MSRAIRLGKFEWDEEKSRYNQEIHGIAFEEAMEAFLDPERIIAQDEAHSAVEERYFCIGKIGKRIATVRFTYRHGVIRIIGAGYWRKGERFYESEKTKRQR